MGNFYQIYIENFNYLPDDQYCCVKSLTCFNIFFQVFDEKIAIEINLIGEADIKVDPEVFCDANDDQANFNGTRRIIICLSTIFILYIFYCCFYDLFLEYIFISKSNMVNFIQLYLYVFFGHAEEMATVYNEIDVKDEPLFPPLECDQVCSVIFMT